MPIDWFTVGAQILNFLILVWILHRFLYRPVLRATEERQKRVEADLRAASEEKEAAALERDELERKAKDLERERETLLATSAKEAEAERARLLEEARQDIQRLRDRWRAGLRNDQKELQERLAGLMQKEAFALAGQLMKDLADEDFQQAMTRKFVRRLEHLSPEERSSLASPFGDDAQAPGGEAILDCSFELSAAQRSEIETAVRGIIGADAPLRFETKPGIGGIQLRADGHRISWTTEQYLSSLEAGLQSLMDGEASAHEQVQ